MNKEMKETLAKIAMNPVSSLVLKSMWKQCNVKFPNGDRRVSFLHTRANKGSDFSIDAKTLKNGFYTYLIEFNPVTENFTVKVAPVINSLEWCCKHFYLKRNNQNSIVVIGGELVKEGDKLTFNFLSGTYSAKLMKKLNNKEVLHLQKVVKHVLSNYSKRPITYVFTTEVLICAGFVNIKNIPNDLKNSNRITLPKNEVNKVKVEALRGGKKIAVNKAKINIREKIRKYKTH
jgi:hypothetical protein